MATQARFLLAIESTCDETAAALIGEDGTVLASAVASQEKLHEQFGGVVPEIAARAHLERILPILDTVLKRGQISSEQIAAIAVATEPGLPGSLLVGLSAAKALCLAWNKPLVTINHVQAHIYACQLTSPEPLFPCVGLVVSGGHSNFYRCDSSTDWTYLGGTIDDAAGEAFDKVAVMLGIPFPGGPNLAKLAEHGNPKAHTFPRPLLHDSSRLDFSFSGLKTAVRYHLVGSGKQNFEEVVLTDQARSDLAASFQQAVIDCLVGKSLLALKQTGLSRLCVGGGVAANSQFREQLEKACQKARATLYLAQREYCTDNAVMGALGWEKVRAGQFADLAADASPGLQRRR
ncbi:MAG: tRNA (adenosine(37)-N6)-threonylcarbamoyltransferase complex transferase subunit TsaD [Pirellulales bacterium]